MLLFAVWTEFPAFSGGECCALKDGRGAGWDRQEFQCDSTEVLRQSQRAQLCLLTGRSAEPDPLARFVFSPGHCIWDQGCTPRLFWINNYLSNWQWKDDKLYSWNLLSLSENPRFPETRAWRSSSSGAFAVAMCGNSWARACNFSHISSVPWIPELMNLLTSAFPQRLVLLQWYLLSFPLPLPRQTCMGKDVTLHVSASNPAMLLYQKFGFKTEEYILDFYDKYYPLDSKECKHAFFLRLRRWAAGGVWGPGKSPIHPKNSPSFPSSPRWRTLAATGGLEHADVFTTRTLDVNSETLYVENTIQEDWLLCSKGRGLEMPTRILKLLENWKWGIFLPLLLWRASLTNKQKYQTKKCFSL